MNRGAGSERPLRVCVCTSIEGAAEPRAPRHVAAIAALGQDFEVVFVDCAPEGIERRSVKALSGLPNLTWRTHRFSTRSTNPMKLALDRTRQRLAKVCFKFSGMPTPGALSARAFGLKTILDQVAADVYLAHNVETLLPAALAAQRRGALLMFDSMEFHSDMGDSQTAIERDIVRAIERRWLPECALILASSDQVADALVAEYGVARPMALYNVPPVENEIPSKPDRGLALYWRNTVVGLGQRGLDEALVALTKLPEDVSLHLQGRMPTDGGAAMKGRIAELGLEGRVIFHPPYMPEEAVKEAARHHVGLCLERRGVRNHELTVSNKIFDYHMAGLVVIASDLPGLRGVIDRSSGGLLFEPGSANDLAVKVLTLYKDRQMLKCFAVSAREFALREANRETEMKKFAAAFRDVCRVRLRMEI
jgi:glycosyltransferase involved in cell wall biosynthesis